MKTKIYTFPLLSALLLTMGACLSDGKDDYLNEFDSFIYLLKAGEQPLILYKTGEKVTYNITVDKGGNNLDINAYAELRILDDYDIEYYNLENGTSYKNLPSDCYALPSDMSVSFSEEELYQVRTIILDPNKIYSYNLDEPGEYVLIVALENGTSPIPEKNKYLVLKPTVLSPVFSLGESGFILPFTIITDQLEYEYTIPVELSAALPIPVVCNVAVDESILTAYNVENKTNYKLILDTDDNYIVNDVSFVAGATVADLSVKINIKNLHGEYALPLVVTSEQYGIKGENKIILALNTIPKIVLTEQMLSLGGTIWGDYDFSKWLDLAGTITYAQVIYGEPSNAYPFPHYVNVTLDKAISYLKVKYATKVGNRQDITEFTVQVSKNGTSNWTDVKTFTEREDGLPTSAGAYYDSAVMNLINEYKYIRLRITKSNNSKYPTWALSVFELYGR